MTNRREFAALSIAVTLLLGIVWPGVIRAEEPGSASSELERIIEEINSVRERAGVRRLYGDHGAAGAAASYADELAVRRELGHRGTDGSRVAERYREAGGTGLRAGENLGAGDDWKSVVNAWMNSPSHRENLLNPDWYGVGAGLHRLESGRIILVVVFTDSQWEPTSMSFSGDAWELRGIVHHDPHDFPRTVTLEDDSGIFSPSSVEKIGPGKISITFRISTDGSRPETLRPLFLRIGSTSGVSDLLFLNGTSSRGGP